MWLDTWLPAATGLLTCQVLEAGAAEQGVEGVAKLVEQHLYLQMVGACVVQLSAAASIITAAAKLAVQLLCSTKIRIVKPRKHGLMICQRLSAGAA
jgi:hypothetical protein